MPPPRTAAAVCWGRALPARGPLRPNRGCRGSGLGGGGRVWSPAARSSCGGRGRWGRCCGGQGAAGAVEPDSVSLLPQSIEPLEQRKEHTAQTPQLFENFSKCFLSNNHEPLGIIFSRPVRVMSEIVHASPHCKITGAPPTNHLRPHHALAAPGQLTSTGMSANALLPCVYEMGERRPPRSQQKPLRCTQVVARPSSERSAGPTNWRCGRPSL